MLDDILSSLDGYEGSVLVERIAFLLESDIGLPAEAKYKYAATGLQYLSDLGCTASPHLDLFHYYSNGWIPHRTTGERLADTDEIQLDILAHKYPEALHKLDSKHVTNSNFFGYVEQRLRILLLSRDYKSVIGSQNYINSTDNATLLGEDELEAQKRVYLLIVFAYFLNGAFLECCVALFGYLSKNHNILDAVSDPRFTSFISRDEMMLCITIACLVATPMNKYDGFMFSYGAQQLLRLNPLLLECLDLLRNIKFRRFFEIWNDTISLKCRSSLFLSQSWCLSQSIMYSKVIFLYTKITDSTPITYLSRILRADETKVKEEIERLIELGAINSEIRENVLVHVTKDPLVDVVHILGRTGRALQERLNALRVHNLELSDYTQGLILSTKDVMTRTINVSRHNIHGTSGIDTHNGNLKTCNPYLKSDSETLEFDEEG